MSVSGIFEDSYGLPVDIGRNKYSSDGLVLVEIRQDDFKFLSLGQTYHLVVSNDEYGSFSVDISFLGVDITYKVTYVHSNGTINETHSSVFNGSLVWLDEDDSPKNTPKGTTEEPTTMGNSSKNARIVDGYLHFNTTDGKEYILKKGMIATADQIDQFAENITEFFTNEKITSYINGDATVYAEKYGKPPY